MTCSFSVLIISKESLAPLISERIREENTDCTIDATESTEEALILFEKNTYDLVICQYTIADVSSVLFLEALQEKENGVPLIVIAEKADHESLIDALYRGLECTVLPASDQAYTIERIQQKIVSVLKRKKQEKTSETYQIQSSGIIAHIPNPMFAIDLKGRVIAWNKAIEDLTAVPAADVLGKGDYEYAIPFYGKRRPKLINQVTVSGKERETEYQNMKRTGPLISVESMPLKVKGRDYFFQIHAAPIYDDSEKIIGAVESITNITAIKQGEEALRESEAKYRGIAERISDLLLSTDSQGIITYASPSVREILGYEPEYVCKKRLENMLLPESLDEMCLVIERVHQGEDVKGLELFFRKNDGTHAILEMSASPIREKNIITGMQVIGRDVTGKKFKENRILRLLDEQKELLGIIDKSPVVVFLWKAEENWPVERVTDNVSRFGYTVEDFLSGKVTFKSVIHPDDREQVIAEISYNSVHDVDSFAQAYRVIGKDTSVHWVEDFTHARRDTTGKITHFQGVIVDITRRKVVEEALRQSEVDYKQLFDSSPVSLWEVEFSPGKRSLDELRLAGISDFRKYFDEHPEEVSRRTGMVTVLNVNNATLHLLEAASKDELATSFQTLLTDESQGAFREMLITLAEGGNGYSGESSYTTLSGQEVSVIFQMVVVPGYEETLGRILISLLDITEQKKVEAALQEVNKKLNLLGNITRHDILNQLMVAQGYMEMLEMDACFPPGSQEKNYAGMVSGAIETIRQEILFTGDYRDLGEQAPKWFHVKRVIRENYGHNGFQKMQLVNDVGDLEIYADPLFTKVIYNLFDNALNHGEGMTTMKFSCVQSKSQAGVDFICEDDGVGIPDDVKEKIFTREYYKNSGFGLFLSREILSITGLSIEENGEEGEGARFVIHVPEGMFRVGE